MAVAKIISRMILLKKEEGITLPTKSGGRQARVT